MYTNAYNTIQYEVNAIGDTKDAVSGTGVTITSLPTGLAYPKFYYVITPATSTTQVDGVVSTRSPVINDKTPGKIVLLNAGFIPVKLSKDAMKDTIVKVTTSEGKFGEATTGTRSEAVTMEDGKADEIVWARPAKIDV